MLEQILTLLKTEAWVQTEEKRHSERSSSICETVICCILKIRINFRDVTTRSQGAWHAPTLLPPSTSIWFNRTDSFDI